MRQRNFVFAFASVAALLLVAVPATGQLVGDFPVFAVPSGGEEASTVVAVQFARGLNATSRDNSSWAAYGVRSMRRFSVSAAVGYVAGQIKTPTIGGQAAFHLLPNAENYQISIQGGIGYSSISGEEALPFGVGDVSNLNLPVGLALEAQPSENSRIWIMPRLHTERISDDLGDTDHNYFGLSLGMAASSEGGVGVHAAFDFIDNDDRPIYAAIGMHYILGR